MSRANRYGCGFTLIELVISITVLALGAVAFLLLVNQATRHSIDPLVRQQAHALAQSYLEEVLLNTFCDPDVTDDCPNACTVSACGSASCTAADPGGRPVFDDVCDYDGIDDTSGPVDQNGDPLAPAILGAYNVGVEVIDTGIDLNGLDSDAGQVVRVDVIVTHDNFTDLNITLSGYKANF